MKTFFSILTAVFLSGAGVGTAVGQSELEVHVLARPSVSVPIGAQRVQLLNVRLTASCAKDVVLHSLTFHHRGLGNPSDISRVYAMVGNVRKTRSFSPASGGGRVTLQLRRFPVPKCTTVTLDILADFSESAAVSGQHSLELRSAADIQTDATVKISIAPTGHVPVATAAGKRVGTVSVEHLSLPQPLVYGDRRVVSRLRLRADSRSDQKITAITFVNDGSARDNDLQNLSLETSGHVLLSNSLPSMDGDRVRVELRPPLILRRNEIRLVQLVADIRASRRRTIRFVIQEPSDVEAQSTR